MTTAQLEKMKAIEPGGRILLQGVSWSLYEHLLQELGESHLFFTYDRGDLEIMSPSLRHDRRKTIIARMVELAAFVLNMDVMGCGSTTCKRPDLEKGLEPNEWYYIQNYDRMWDKEDLELEKDPPPDLAIEADITNSSIDRAGIYASLAVPELWRWDGKTIRYFALRSGVYSPIQDSIALPGLTAAKLQEFIDMSRTVKENEVVHLFADWAKTHVRRWEAQH
ncbi:MAG TPA: Uma2 family endonuclease [Planctomycetota bacterium]|nr:Uma2 family endonuclease [Planctomycetota bacterium]